jgi:hypothetical protein
MSENKDKVREESCKSVFEAIEKNPSIAAHLKDAIKSCTEQQSTSTANTRPGGSFYGKIRNDGINGTSGEVGFTIPIGGGTEIKTTGNANAPRIDNSPPLTTPTNPSFPQSPSYSYPYSGKTLSPLPTPPTIENNKEASLGGV